MEKRRKGVWSRPALKIITNVLEELEQHFDLKVKDREFGCIPPLIGLIGRDSTISQQMDKE